MVKEKKKSQCVFVFQIRRVNLLRAECETGEKQIE